ncbi:MAG: YdcH family protein [Sphingomonadaceae bacterium]
MNPIIHRLSLVHTRLESEIRRELKTRWPDRDRVTRLKKLKLAIKDRLYGTARRALSAG